MLFNPQDLSLLSEGAFLTTLPNCRAGSSQPVSKANGPLDASSPLTTLCPWLVDQPWSAPWEPRARRTWNREQDLG